MPIYEAGRWVNGRPFYAMKMVAGRSLDAMIAEARSLDERLAMLPNIITVAEAVAYAHGEGVIHRDLKPANVVVGPFGETVVIDWGVAKDLSAPVSSGGEVDSLETPDEGMTVAGSVLGTPAYMSPEQARGGPMDARTDVYSLGALLYHMLAGVAPYQGSSRDVLAAVVAGPPRRIEEVEPGVPLDLVTILEKAMARDKRERFETAKELADELVRWQAGQLVSVHRYSTGALVARWVRRHRVSVAVSVAALVALAVMTVVSVRRIVRQEEAARRTSSYLLAEQARHELLGVQPERALAVLRELEDRAASDAVLQFLFARVGALLPAMTFEGDGQLTSAVFSPDGHRMAVSSRRGTVQIWDVDSGQRSLTIRVSERDVSTVRFSADGRHILAATYDGTASAWDTVGRRRLTFRGHRGIVWSATYSADGTRVVTAGDDGTARTWDARTGDALRVLTGHRNGVTGAIYLPDGGQIATVSLDGAARVWSSETGVCVRTLLPPRSALRHRDPMTGRVTSDYTKHRLTLRALACSPDGTFLAAADLDQVMLWNLVTGGFRFRSSGHRDHLTGVEFDATGTRLVTTSEDESAKVWDVATDKLILSLDGHVKAVLSAAFSPDGARVLTASHDGTARLWDLARAPRLLSFGPQAIKIVRFSPDGARVVAVDVEGGAAILNAASGHAERTLSRARTRRFAAFVDPGRLLVDDADGVARLWSVDTGSPVSAMPLGSPDVRILACRGRRMISGGGAETWVSDPASGARLRTLPVIGARDAALCGDGRRVAVLDAKDDLTIWDTASGEKHASVPESLARPWALACSPDGTLVVTGGSDEMGRVWHVDTGKLVSSLVGHRRGIRSIAFSPDGAFIATGSSDDFVNVWDARTGNRLASLEAPSDVVEDLDFSPDGSQLVLAGEDGTVRFLDVHLADAAERLRLVRHRVPWRMVEGRVVP